MFAVVAMLIATATSSAWSQAQLSMMKLQKPPMQESTGSFGDAGGQQSASLAHFSLIFEHIGGSHEHVPVVAAPSCKQ